MYFLQVQAQIFTKLRWMLYKNDGRLWEDEDERMR